MPQDTHEVTERTSILADVLISKIDQYHSEETSSARKGKLAQEDPLYDGIKTHTKDYEKSIAEYNEKYKLNLDLQNDEVVKAIEDKTFFRQRFAHLIARIMTDPDWISFSDEALRSTDPEAATIKMEDFLGADGLALYKLALEEEMHSMAFRDAVLAESTKVVEGEKWVQRPVIIIGGPSASGKSYAADFVLDEVSRFVSTEENTSHKNKVISIDGGKGREVSQIRNWVITTCNEKGFSGVSDLHKKSSVLGSMKKKVYRHASLSPEKPGLIIPETFAKPLDKIVKKLKSFIRISDSVTIFTTVTGKDRETFKDVVAFQGSRRAWKTSGFKDITSMAPHDLANYVNTKADCESKRYGAKYFKFGVKGSYVAQIMFRWLTKFNYNMTITSDLMLLTEEPEASGEWRRSTAEDKKKILVSERIFNAWCNAKKTDPNTVTLPNYIKLHRIGPIIQTSSEVKFAIARKELQKKIAKLEKSKQSRKRDKADLLGEISKELDTLDIRNLTQITKLQQKLHAVMEELNANTSQRSLHAARDTYQKIENLDRALVKLSNDIENAHLNNTQSNAVNDIALYLREEELAPTTIPGDEMEEEVAENDSANESIDDDDYVDEEVAETEGSNEYESMDANDHGDETVIGTMEIDNTQEDTVSLQQNNDTSKRDISAPLTVLGDELSKNRDPEDSVDIAKLNDIYQVISSNNTADKDILEKATQAIVDTVAEATKEDEFKALSFMRLGIRFSKKETTIERTVDEVNTKLSYKFNKNDHSKFGRKMDKADYARWAEREVEKLRAMYLQKQMDDGKISTEVTSFRVKLNNDVPKPVLKAIATYCALKNYECVFGLKRNDKPIKPYYPSQKEVAKLRRVLENNRASNVTLSTDSSVTTGDTLKKAMDQILEDKNEMGQAKKSDLKTSKPPILRRMFQLFHRKQNKAEKSGPSSDPSSGYSL